MIERTGRQKRYMAFKRILGTGIALLLLTLLAPVFIAVALLIRIDSEGPVLFRQERLGLDGRIFSIYKFRTMEVGAEFKGDGMYVKSRKDPRITRIGRILRLLSIDELPQLWNVVKGEMSLIGPRPPLTYHPYPGYEAYPDDIKRRFLFRPGMTGLAQVSHGYGTPWKERFELDIVYVDSASLCLDLSIALRTVATVLAPKPRYKGSE